jgi:UDP:flavonoid glycosyltransferase YjiC (YdhE family)
MDAHHRCSFCLRIPKDAVVVLSPHPGDVTLRAVDSATGKGLNFYEEIAADSPLQSRYITKDVLPTLDMVAGADLVIEFTGSASVCAAYQRIPLIHVTPQVWLTRFAKEAGEATIETIEVGAGIWVKEISEHQLISAIRELLDSSSHSAQCLRVAQEEAYPIPTDCKASLTALVSALGAQLGL